MAIPSRQIGWGVEENLLYEISKQLEALTGVISKIGQPTTTTTTTTAAPVPGNVDIAKSTDFNINGDFTIEMFVKLSNNNGFPRPYSFGAYPAPNAMSIEGGQLYFWANNSALLSGTFNPAVGQWYHIAVVGSGSMVEMYINGNSVATAPYVGTISSQDLPLTIGYGNEPNSYFNGLISNFRWTNAALYSGPVFTVPSEPLVTQGPLTVLNIFQGNSLSAQLTDNSFYGHNATNAGATYSADSPFGAPYEGSLQMGTV